MKEKIDKEILTKEIIKKDIKGILRYNIAMNFLYSVVFSLVILVWHWAFTLTDIPKQKLIISTSVVIALIFGLFFACAVRCFIMLSKIKNNHFDVIEDRLYDKRINKLLAHGNGTKIPAKPLLTWIFKSPLNLFFEKNKKFNLPMGYYYNFSDKIHIDFIQVFNSSDICDKFYLIKINNRVVELYNTKLFELEE